jgi:hypothetical protein
MAMNNWKTIATVALVVSLILPSLAIPQEGSQHVTGMVVGLDRVRGVIALLTEHGLMYVEGPREALESVKVGEVIELSVVRDAQNVSRSSRTYPRPPSVPMR